MHLKALYLHQFRLYEEALFEFSPKINVIRGPNARGKTSLIEAIYFLATGRSFRTSQTSDLIRHGADRFYLDACFVKHGIEQKLRVYYSANERRVIYNTTPSPFLNRLLGLLQGVVIHPDDAIVVKGGPAGRRHLLDLQLAQRDPLYVHHLTRYDRAMRQRNHLLRAKSAAAIDSWEHEMANSAAYVVQQRALATEDLRMQGQEHYHKICGGGERLGLAYKPYGAGNAPLSDLASLRTLYRDHYQRHRKREMEIGSTLTGPHKDDLTIILGEKEARTFASEGQQRSCIVALRLAEWEKLQSIAQETPMMLVDDLGMSLDASRRRHLLVHLSSLDQVFITTTEENSLLSNEHSIVVQ